MIHDIDEAIGSALQTKAKYVVCSKYMLRAHRYHFVVAKLFQPNDQTTRRRCGRLLRKGMQWDEKSRSKSIAQQKQGDPPDEQLPSVGKERRAEREGNSPDLQMVFASAHRF
ncbi:MAG: hypothetical protein ACRYHB_07065 [Janthinobacterium lividum]